VWFSTIAPVREEWIAFHRVPLGYSLLPAVFALFAGGKAVSGEISKVTTAILLCPQLSVYLTENPLIEPSQKF